MKKKEESNYYRKALVKPCVNMCGHDHAQQINGLVSI